MKGDGPPKDGPWKAQDPLGEGWEQTYAAAYEDLKQAARHQLRTSSGLFDTTALVNETFLKLSGNPQAAPTERGHLLALSARAMRHVIVDEVRRRQSDKRGNGARPLTLDTRLGIQDQAFDVLEVDQLLHTLAGVDPRAARVVELRCFGGHTEMEIAGLLGVTERTVQRDWRKARAFLMAQLG